MDSTITEYEIAEQFGPDVAVVEVHWATGRVEMQYNTGILTANHASSSYGLPVFVAGSNSRTVPSRQLIPGQVYGPADLPAGYKMVWIVGHQISCNEGNNYDIKTEANIVKGAKAAGYDVVVGESPDHM